MLRDPDEVLPALAPSTSLGFHWDRLCLSISLGSNSDPFASSPDDVTTVDPCVPPEGHRGCSPGTGAALPSSERGLQFLLLASATHWSPIPAPSYRERRDEADIWRMGRCRRAGAGRRVPRETWH